VTRYLVLIYLQPDQRDALRRYEQRALPVFRRHGGAFERIWSPVPSRPAGSGDPEGPDEIHVLRFESPEGLDAVRRDPEMQTLVPLRETIVRKTLLIRIEDVPLGRYFGTGD
jgi:uncharacterized protein (DUF1330 family)